MRSGGIGGGGQEAESLGARLIWKALKGEAGWNGVGRVGRTQECGREEGALELRGAPDPGSPP